MTLTKKIFNIIFQKYSHIKIEHVCREFSVSCRVGHSQRCQTVRRPACNTAAPFEYISSFIFVSLKYKCGWVRVFILSKMLWVLCVVPWIYIYRTLPCPPFSTPSSPSCTTDNLPKLPSSLPPSPLLTNLPLVICSSCAERELLYWPVQLSLRTTLRPPFYTIDSGFIRIQIWNRNLEIEQDH